MRKRPQELIVGCYRSASGELDIVGRTTPIAACAHRRSSRVNHISEPLSTFRPRCVRCCVALDPDLRIGHYLEGRATPYLC
jgi:hypothetical protein